MATVKNTQVPQGFVRTTVQKAPISSSDRAALIRSANDLFNQGKTAAAERIFIAVKYGDGMARVGDLRFKAQDYQSAMKLYMLAGDRHRIDACALRMSLVLRQWLIEDKAHKRAEGAIDASKGTSNE